MKIAQKYQIFDGPNVIILCKDRDRLSWHLISSGHLNEIFLIGINAIDLQRLIILELMGKKRRDIINRLLSRLLTLRRYALKDRITWLLNQN